MTTIAAHHISIAGTATWPLPLPSPRECNRVLLASSAGTTTSVLRRIVAATALVLRILLRRNPQAAAVWIKM